MTVFDLAEIDLNPLLICHTAESKEDGVCRVKFRDAHTAHAWAMRFRRKNTRFQNQAKKDGMLDVWENARRFVCSRQGATVEVRYLPKASGIVSVE